MKKIVLFWALGLLSLISSAQDLQSGGDNSWLFHTPDDGRKSLFIIPGQNGSNWNFDAQIEISNFGNINIPLQRSIGFINFSDYFQHDGKSVGNYSLGWYTDSWQNGAPSSYYSGYGGIKFFTQSSPRLSIDYMGNVGISTTTPEAKFHVAGNSILGNTYDTWTSFGASNGGRIRGSGEGYLLLASNPSGTGDRNIYYQVHAGYNHVMLGGNLGVGEHSPQAKLTVLENGGLGTSMGNHKLLSRFSVIGNVNHFMINEWLYRDANGADWLSARAHNGISIDASFLTPGVDTRTWWERDPYNNIQSWGDGAQTFMTINQGKVGIGITNPSQKLTVNGTVYSTEVKVDVNAGTGPDYVFEPTYQLPSLTEIENYIKANKHLPEVPSAKEMETNGINLSEMNMLLLKKVEELTLHLIEANKKIEYLTKRIDEKN